MKKEYKFRIYPTVEQEILLAKHFKCVHYIYNYFLNERKVKYLNENILLNYYDNRRTLTQLKKNKEFVWLQEVNAQSLQASIMDLEKSFNKQNEFPKFKSEYDRQSFEVPQCCKLEDGKIIIPKFQEGIKVKIDAEVKGKIGKMNITKTPTGEYYVSILTKQEGDLPKTSEQVEIDFGLKDFAITSDKIKKMEKEEVKQNQKIKAHKLISIFEQQTSNKLHFNVNETIKSLYTHNNINTTLSWDIEFFTVINEKNYFKFLIPCFWMSQMEEEDIHQKGLVFKVDAFRHKGLVLITLNKNGLYDIDLISTKRGIKKQFTNIHFNKIVETINKAIGQFIFK